MAAPTLLSSTATVPKLAYIATKALGERKNTGKRITYAKTFITIAHCEELTDHSIATRDARESKKL